MFLNDPEPVYFMLDWSWTFFAITDSEKLFVIPNN